MGLIDDTLINHASELLAPWGAISARRMFGGWGVYRGALMFALVADDLFYMKSGAALRLLVGDMELIPFTYDKPQPNGKKKKVVMSYAAVPPDVLESSEALCAWAEAAYQDALAGRRNAAGGKPHTPMKRKTGRGKE